MTPGVPDAESAFPLMSCAPASVTIVAIGITPPVVNRCIWNSGMVRLTLYVEAVLVPVAVTLRPAETRRIAAPRLAALREAPGWLPFTSAYFLFGFGYIIVITYTVASLREEGGFSVAHAANTYAAAVMGVLPPDARPIVDRQYERIRLAQRELDQLRLSRIVG